jgi:hypothetical protein
MEENADTESGSVTYQGIRCDESQRLWRWRFEIIRRRLTNRLFAEMTCEGGGTRAIMRETITQGEM